ncbi:hypothetical protein V490_08039 [Pseudogymnoascus sp. VKM F-3557]|nr:hypothetical protein V490_08039 [Pseudogymnoascus sp. VKM F-3557]
MGYGMMIRTRRISAGDANMTTPTRRELRSSLDRQNSANPQNGLKKIIEEEEGESDEDYYVADEENSDDEIDDDREEEDNEEDMDNDSEQESENDDDNDEYEEDFVDDEAEDSEDSQATFLPSTLISDNGSDEDEETSGTESEAETLCLVDELKNLGIRSD